MKPRPILEFSSMDYEAKLRLRYWPNSVRTMDVHIFRKDWYCASSMSGDTRKDSITCRRDWASPPQKLGGYSLSRAVANWPSACRPMDAVFGGSATNLHWWRSWTKSGRFSTSKSVGFGLCEPNNPCITEMRQNPGSCKSRCINANLHMLGSSSSFGSAGCSKMPAPPHILS